MTSQRATARSKDEERLLKAIHVMNADGSVSADMRRKLNQVRHVVDLFRPVLEEVARRRRAVRLVDANCGNSYLAFLLYQYVTTELRVPAEILGVDRSGARVAACRDRAAALQYEGMTFVEAGIGDADIPPGFDILTSLHGCDVATDDALKRGVESRIPHLHVAPCCQREVRPLLLPGGRFGPFLHDGIVAAECAALVTDAIRALWLRTKGYRAEVIEFVPLEHTAKNRMIRAKFTKRRDDAARREFDALLADLSSPPAIAR